MGAEVSTGEIKTTINIIDRDKKWVYSTKTPPPRIIIKKHGSLEWLGMFACGERIAIEIFSGIKTPLLLRFILYYMVDKKWVRRADDIYPEIDKCHFKSSNWVLKKPGTYKIYIVVYNGGKCIQQEGVSLEICKTVSH